MKFKFCLDIDFWSHFNLILIVVLASLNDCAAIRNRNTAAMMNRNNVVIYAKIGQSVNISCWFDPNLFKLNNNFNFNKRKRKHLQASGGLNEKTRSKNKRRNLMNHHSHKSKIFANSGDASAALYSTNENHNFNNEQQLNKKYVNYFRPNQNQFDNNIESDNQHAVHHETDDYFPNANNNDNNMLKIYELDWYFLDKQGRMNIISYGNRTSNEKYKTFVISNRRSHHSQSSHESQASASSLIRSRIMNPDHDNAELGYSSSALYSQQQASRSSNTNDYENEGKYYTYYLNTLIESEDDEGVYQCINPDLPNFTLRNVTILIENHSNVLSVSMYQTCSMLFVTYILLVTFFSI